ncbi:MAG TPA: hypothetical protein VKE40_00100 [Gemmataceae bacterium]|nr:hypothetical protein [Gemmataceae bacterium]
MRLLFAIPHYFNPDPAGGGRHGSVRKNPRPRVEALTACLIAIRQLFGRPHCIIDIFRRTTVPANHHTAVQADVVVCTTGPTHLIGQLPLGPGYFAHLLSSADPRLLGFECHAALRDRLGQYDYYCYLEDDLILHDPWFFVKLQWFTGQFGEDAVLMPNRYEAGRNKLVHRVYVDGPIRPDVTTPFQDVSDTPELMGDVLGMPVAFRRVHNPHSGAFFLTARQMATWAARPYFLDRDTRFIGPLESAASLGVMRTFRVYKPVPEVGAFLEIEHFGNGFLDLIKAQPGEGVLGPPG